MSQLIREIHLTDAVVLQLRQGDLTREPVDAIVNAANGYLSHGGGVAAAISRAGGRAVQQESTAWVREHGVVPTGGVAVTTAGAMPAQAVIHTVGPIWNGGVANEAQLLAAAVASSLQCAEERGYASIAFPAISAGIYGYPHDECAEVMVNAMRGFVEKVQPKQVRDIRIVVFDNEMARAFGKQLPDD